MPGYLAPCKYLLARENDANKTEHAISTRFNTNKALGSVNAFEHNASQAPFNIGLRCVRDN